MYLINLICCVHLPHKYLCEILSYFVNRVEESELEHI
jgi:hypothetical protein